MNQQQFEHYLALAYEVGTGFVVMTTAFSKAFPNQKWIAAVGRWVGTFVLDLHKIMESDQ